jgi:hypothetical protein
MDAAFSFASKLPIRAFRLSLSSEFETQQVLNEIALFSFRKAQIHAPIVVFNHRIQIGEAAIVIKPTLQVCR